MDLSLCDPPGPPQSTHAAQTETSSQAFNEILAARVGVRVQKQAVVHVHFVV